MKAIKQINIEPNQNITRNKIINQNQILFDQSLLKLIHMYTEKKVKLLKPQNQPSFKILEKPKPTKKTIKIPFLYHIRAIQTINY